MAPAELSDCLQAVLGAAYRVEKELGGGGMSRVFVAEETRLARRVVVKVLRERAIEGYSRVVQTWRNPDPELEPFVAEARAALARLNAEPRKSGS